jgi:hypothetical protein
MPSPRETTWRCSGRCRTGNCKGQQHFGSRASSRAAARHPGASCQLARALPRQAWNAVSAVSVTVQMSAAALPTSHSRSGLLAGSVDDPGLSQSQGRRFRSCQPDTQSRASDEGIHPGRRPFWCLSRSSHFPGFPDQTARRRGPLGTEGPSSERSGTARDSCWLVGGWGATVAVVCHLYGGR